MYVLSLAGEKIKSIKYQSKRQAFCEAELFKYYVRNRYGTKLSTMRPSLPEEDLREYTAEMGYELSPRSVEIHFPHKIKDLFVDYGAKIGRDLADLEFPSTKQVIVRETLREARLERESLKCKRLELRDRLSKERAVVWREAQTAVSEAWKTGLREEVAALETRLQLALKCLQSALNAEEGWQGRAAELLQKKPS